MAFFPFALIGLLLMLLYISFFQLPYIEWLMAIVSIGLTLGSVWVTISAFQENNLLKKKLRYGRSWKRKRIILTLQPRMLICSMKKQEPNWNMLRKKSRVS